MPIFSRGDVHIHYDIDGDGFPVLLIAPGGMRSVNQIWQQMPWNPRVELGDDYRVVGMDQRNAGASSGPVSADDGWHTYAADQLALLDHLGIAKCHVIGMCIGGPYIVGLLRTDPERFCSAVMLQPVGIDDNRSALEEMFDAWATDIAPDHPEIDEAGWHAFRSNMWDGEFVLTATPAEMASIETPLLVLMGDDLYHPAATSRDLVAAAPTATLVEHWKDEVVLPQTHQTIAAFLAEHTP